MNSRDDEAITFEDILAVLRSVLNDPMAEYVKPKQRTTMCERGLCKCAGIPKVTENDLPDLTAAANERKRRFGTGAVPPPAGA